MGKFVMRTILKVILPLLTSTPPEQCGYVVSGHYRLKIESPENIDVVLNPGDSYAIPGHTPHSFKRITGGEVVDVFTPPREDYL